MVLTSSVKPLPASGGKESSLTLEWVTINGTRCLKFNFSGILTSQNATRKVEEWRTLWKELSDQKVNVIFDCKRMTDYEQFARIVFQKAIKEFKPQINAIWVISTSKIIIAGATIMGLFATFPIKTVDSKEQIEFSHTETFSPGR